MLDFLIKKIPPLPTSRSVIKFLLETMENKEKKVFVDLGCGMGKVLIAVKKRFPETQVIGYEIWPSQFVLAKIKIFLAGIKAKVFYKDMFEADLKNADIVFCFLLRNFMAPLEKKFEKELKAGALVISNTFTLPNWKPVKTIRTHNNEKSSFGTLYIYKKE
jgi:SAM-dependent methyltransferase